MKYIKPKCECGENLVIVEERTYERIYNITRNGDLSDKKRIRKRDVLLADVGLAGSSWLECNQCHKEYDIDYDDNNRIIRGDIR